MEGIDRWNWEPSASGFQEQHLVNFIRDQWEENLRKKVEGNGGVESWFEKGMDKYVSEISFREDRFSNLILSLKNKKIKKT